MNNIEQRAQFLRRVQPPDINKIAELAAEKGYMSYEALTSLNAHRNGRVTPEDAERLSELLYRTWYKNTLTTPTTELHAQIIPLVEKLRTSPHLHPDDVKQQGFYNFLKGNRWQSEFGGTKLMRFAHNQYGGCFIGSDGFFDDDFLYIEPDTLFGRRKGSDRGNTECRLYLNLKAKNICPVAEQLVQRSDQTNTPIEFKITGTDDRTDTVVIYTNYDNVERILDIINRIKSEKPKLFEGAENINPGLGILDDVIGFGEDPAYKKSSFNFERAEALTEYIKPLKDSIITSIVNDPINSTKLHDALYTYFHSEIKRLLEIRKAHNTTPQEVQAFETERQKLLKEVEAQTQKIKNLIEKTIINYKTGFKDDNTITPKVSFGKPVGDLYMAGINKALLKAFPEKQKELQTKITNLEGAEPYFRTHDISIENFALNASTTDALKGIASKTKNEPAISTQSKRQNNVHETLTLDETESTSKLKKLTTKQSEDKKREKYANELSIECIHTEAFINLLKLNGEVTQEALQYQAQLHTLIQEINTIPLNEFEQKRAQINNDILQTHQRLAKSPESKYKELLNANFINTETKQVNAKFLERLRDNGDLKNAPPEVVDMYYQTSDIKIKNSIEAHTGLQVDVTAYCTNQITSKTRTKPKTTPHINKEQSKNPQTQPFQQLI